MVMLHKLTPDNWISVLSDRNFTILAYAKEATPCFGIVRGEIGIVRYTMEGNWQIAFSGGWEMGLYKTLADLLHFEFKLDSYLFFSIEIKP
jgi:hypothetical protein